MTASALSAALHRIGQIQPHLPAPVSVLLAVAAAMAAFVPGLWEIARHVTVIAHEAAHAVMAWLLASAVKGITFDSGASGATSIEGGGPVGQFCATLIGYLGPSGFGVAAAALISAGYSVAVLWVSLAGVFAILMLVRMSFGVISVAVTFAALFLIAGFASVGAQVLTAYVLAWFLLMSGIRIIVIRGAEAADAALLCGMTRIPRGFWSRLWLLGSVGALIFGATLLV